MRFSIIVPVYNVAEYLPQCMASLLEQDCHDCEIILVDDGSTDGSEILCDGYRSAYPETVRVIHQANGGLGAARNTGIEAARGEYLLFVDSDDYLTHEALACLSRQIDGSAADMYIFGFDLLWGDVRTPGEVCPLAGQGCVTLSERPELLLHTPSACLRAWHRRLFRDPAVRFPGRVWYEDLRTTAKAMNLCRSIVAVPDRLYIYRQRQGSIMHSPNLRRNLEIIDAMDDLEDYFRDRGIFDRYRDWLCCLTAENMCMASQRVLMAAPNADYLPDFMNYLTARYPDYETNPVLDRLGRRKKLALKLLKLRRYRLLRLIYLLRAWMRGEKRAA